ncbi:MAG TPA: MarR family transcriptional regulator [Planctomycetaceae bacterium]|nr:MarR family transcriptional regulator [Planctomycetaceae bacterium]
MSNDQPSSLSSDAIEFDSIEQRVFLHLWRTYDLLKVFEDECLTKFEITAQQYNVLRILKSVSPEGLPTMQLGQRMISRGPDMTRMLDRLESRHLIKRQRQDSNRRVVEAWITAIGLSMLDSMHHEILTMHQKQVGHLSPDQHQQLIQLLRLVRKPHEDASCDWLG